MGLNSLGLGFVFTARDLASAKLAALERRFASLDERIGLGTERMSDSFHALSTGVAIFAAGASMVVGAFTLAGVAGRFEQSIAAVGAVSTATADELGALRDAAIDAGIATQFSPSEATLGLQELAQAGFGVQESIALLRPTLELAAGSLGKLSPQSAAGLAAQAMKAFGINAEGAALAVDQMLQAVNVFALDASELPLGLGTASRGAQALGQSLSETLISLGLIKNVIPGIERASTAASVAMERLAEPEVQSRLRALGVDVVRNGGFRAFLDVLGELTPALERMSQAQRSAFLLQAFGRDALGGVNAILAQLTAGIRTATGASVRGAEAIAYLRSQFEQASGTASHFAEQMLATFAGQRQLLTGSVETLAIVLGEPFARALRPFVTASVNALNAFLRFVRAVPQPVQQALAGIALAAGALTGLVGAAVAAKASLALIGIGVAALGISLGGIVALVAPAILAVGALSAAALGLSMAVKKNLGGTADFVQRLGAGISLFFRGLKQTFELGGFSDAVREELGRAENLGLKQFLIRTYQLAFRLQQVWSGLHEGFHRAIEEAHPVFAELIEAMTTMGRELSSLLGSAATGAALLPSSGFRAFGHAVGAGIGTAVRWLVQLGSILVRVGAGIAIGLGGMEAVFAPVLSALGAAFSELGAAWRALLATTNEASVDLSFDGWRAFGQLLGKLAGGAIALAIAALTDLVRISTAVITVVAGIKDAFIGLGTWLGETAAKIYLWFTEALPKAIATAIDSVARMLAPIRALLSGLPSQLVPSWSSVLPLDGSTQRGAVAAEPRQSPPASSDTRRAVMPALVEPAARALDLSKLLDGAQAPRTPARSGEGVTVNVQVDGETIARAVHRAERASATRSFSPLAVY